VRIPLLDHHRSGEVFRSNRIAAALLLASGLPCGAQAQSRAELDEIRKQIQEVKDAYETRLQALEQRLKEAEATAVEAQRQAAQAAPAAGPPAPEAGASATQGRGQITDNRFNPALSVILQGTYGDLTESPHDYVVTGFADAEKIDPGSRGFALGESEISFSANIDQLFYGNLLIGFHEDEVEVEEAFFQTLALGRGFNVKAGRFFSGIGYQNVLHPHAWDFYDAALVQRSFLAKNYGDDGLQLTWVAPLPVFLELGGELGAGRTLPGAFEEHTELVEVDRNKNGVGAYTLFARVGGDLGISNSYRLGASYVDTSTGDESFALADFDTRTGLENAFSGDVQLYGVDLVWKWAPGGNPAQRNLKVVAEWMQLERDGAFTFDVPGAAITDDFKLRQSGWYVQSVFQFLPEWRVGLRYDRLDSGSFSGGANEANVPDVDYDPWRWSAMADWNPSEFSRIRLQYNHDKSREDVTDHQVFLQYIFSLGVHGAHQF
jgi:hypothetical protein